MASTEQQVPGMNQTNSALVGNTCLELALEGERLMRRGSIKDAIGFFEQALKVGTNDARMLSAIYSQLGNAYFGIQDYQKAFEYHQSDVKHTKSIGNEQAEATACGNLGNTCKMLRKFDDANFYCQRQLELSKKLNDKSGQGRALYKLASVHLTKAKQMIGSSELDSGELPEDITSSLLNAVDSYEQCLKVVTELADYESMGRVYGNLGNTHYILGNYQIAVEKHGKRLELARQTNDKSAEMRAHLNLGNAYVFVKNYSEAIENYMASSQLALELQDKYAEAESCYNLANTYQIQADYVSAITYHLRYLGMVEKLNDKAGEGKACWSLSNIYKIVDDPETALVYAGRHKVIAEALNDRTGIIEAEMNIKDLQDFVPSKQPSQQPTDHAAPDGSDHKSTASGRLNNKLSPEKRHEQEQRRFRKHLNRALAADIDGLSAARRRSRALGRSASNEQLFEMIAHFQSGRIDDQRCEFLKRPPEETGKLRVAEGKENLVTKNVDSSYPAGDSTARGSQPLISNPINAVSSALKATYRKASLAAYPTAAMPSSLLNQRRPTVSTEHAEQLFDMIAGAQGQRMDEQRAVLPTPSTANGLSRNPRPVGVLNRGHTLDQSSTSRPGGRLPDAPARPNFNDQEADKSVPSQSVNANEVSLRNKPPKLNKRFQTVDSDARIQNEQFLDSLMKYQSSRFNDQRSEFPRKSSAREDGADFFKLITKFQSDRMDDQRSTPPSKNK